VPHFSSAPPPAALSDRRLQRSFVEERRRTKVIPRFFDERSCLKLAYAALQRAAERWQKVTITELEQRQLELLRQALQPDPPTGKQLTQMAA
jgi:transposase-like protein